MQGKQVVIRKSVIGLLLIYLRGGILSFVFVVAAFYLVNQNRNLAIIMVVGLLVTFVGTTVQAYIYDLSRIVLRDVELDVINWTSLISQNNAICEWRQVQDIDYKKAGILSQLFDYGTLLVQTAGTERNLRITYVPDVERVRDEMAKRAADAPTITKPET